MLINLPEQHMERFLALVYINKEDTYTESFFFYHEASLAVIIS